jgi:ribonuclease G
MQNMLVVNAEGPETRVAVVEEGSLAEFFVERKRDRGMVGNIYRGKVTRVLPGMQAAFVDLGSKVERAAFLYVADVLGSGDEKKLFDDADTDDGDESPEGAASRMARSRKQLAARKIEDLLKPGDAVLVQVVKDPIGLKGARVTGYISLPGRYSVFMPHVAQIGVSKRIGSDKERRRLRDLVNEARPKGTGFIVRTAAEDAIDQELRDDVDFLARVWGEIEARDTQMRGPGLVYADLDLALRCIRDLMREDTSEVVIDDEEQYERIKKFTMAFLPRFTERVKKYDGRRPIFDHYHIEPALRLAVSRRVPLKSGGSLVIDQGEALTAIDINTGSFTNTGSGNLEDTVTANNLEACEEVARQLRLRNIGGIIVIDFVDMDKEGNRRRVWDAFQKALSRDRARTNVTKISELGLVEMTRKRTRESLVQLLTEPCPTCEGSGVVKSVTTVAYEILREVRRSGMLVDNEKIEIEAAPRVAEILSKQERDYLDSLEKRLQKLITVLPQKGWRPDQFRVAGKMSTEIAAQAAAEAGTQGHVHKINGGGVGSGGSGGSGGAPPSGGGGGGGGGRRRRRRGGRGRDRAPADA